MADIIKLLLAFVRGCFRSREELKAENAALRHQLNVLQRKGPKRPQLSGTDRALFVWLYGLFPRALGAMAIIQPETVIGWHRAGFKAWWRWKSRNRGGRPTIDCEIARNIDPARKVQQRIELVAKARDFTRRVSRPTVTPSQFADWRALSMTSLNIGRGHGWTRFDTPGK